MSSTPNFEQIDLNKSGDIRSMVTGVPGAIYILTVLSFLSKFANEVSLRD